MVFPCWMRCKILKFIFFISVIGVCIGMSACSQKDNAGQDIDITEILQGIDEYKTKFISLYTNNVYEDTESAIRIEENDFIYMNEQIATLTRYSDLSDDYLRYKILVGGETGDVIINYHLCEGFIWISEQRNYYSSWMPDTGYPDILYSVTEQWILIGETIYILHDDGILEEVPWEQLNIPALKELDEIMSSDFECADSTEEQEDTESPDMKDSLAEVERLLESNFVEGFAFQESDRAICHYRGRMRKLFDGYVILVYKENEEGILFTGQLGVGKDTGDIYVLEEEGYVPVKAGVLKGFALPDTPKELSVACEEESVEGSYGITEEEWGAVFSILKEEGLENIKMRCDGVYWFLDRKYYWLRRFEENDVQIFTLQYYCIDVENRKFYEVRDEMVTYMSLYYMGNLSTGNDTTEDIIEDTTLSHIPMCFSTLRSAALQD